TDHNAHDPGITLMELLAWVAEAQLYSLSHLRRDERLAYAALLGLAPAGTQPATGLIWPDRLDPNSPNTTFSRSVVISEDALIKLHNTDAPTFTPINKLLWVPGRIVELKSTDASGKPIDLTTTNERGGATFLPFGVGSGRHSVLSLTFQCRDDNGLFGKASTNAKGALWAIGISAAPPLAAIAKPSPGSTPKSSPLTVTLIAGRRRFPLPIASDSTLGMLRTGALLLNLDAVTESPRIFTIEFRSRSGFDRPPRLLRIEPNV